MSESEYAVDPGFERDTDRPESWWRRTPGSPDWEFLSSRDWQWHRLSDFSFRLPKRLQSVSAEHAAVLEADRQRFAQYWFLLQNVGGGVIEQQPRVLRRRFSPEGYLDEAIDSRQEWVKTAQIRSLEEGRDAAPDMVPVDVVDADRFIEERLGVSGATWL